MPRVLLLWGLAWMLACRLPAEDWPQWRGPNRDGVWNEAGILESIPSEGLSVSWRVPVGRGWSSPVIARGRVIVTDVIVTPPAAQERVLCFAETTGQSLWSHVEPVDYPDWAMEPNAGGPRATPIVFDDHVFTLGATGHLLCLNSENGTVAWAKDLREHYGIQSFSGITPSPLIDEDRLILFICGKPAACVVALNKNTGKELWRALDDSFTYSSPILLTAGGRRQLIVWTQQAVTALAPESGEVLWREFSATPGDMAVSTPVAVGRRLLVGGLMLELAADPPAASVLWPESRGAASRVLSNTSTALLQGDYVYSAKISGDLVCLKAATGEQVWQTNRITAPNNGSSIHMTPCGKGVFLFTDQGDLIRAQLSPAGYRESGRARLLTPTSPFGDRLCAWAPPAYANGHVFARNDEELVRASLASKSNSEH